MARATTTTNAARGEHANPAIAVPWRIGSRPKHNVPPRVDDVAEDVHAREHHGALLFVGSTHDIGPGEVGGLPHVAGTLNSEGEELGAVGDVPRQEHCRGHGDDECHQEVDPPSAAEVVGGVGGHDGGDDRNADERQRVVVDLGLGEFHRLEPEAHDAVDARALEHATEAEEQTEHVDVPSSEHALDQIPGHLGRLMRRKPFDCTLTFLLGKEPSLGLARGVREECESEYGDGDGDAKVDDKQPLVALQPQMAVHRLRDPPLHHSRPQTTHLCERREDSTPLAQLCLLVPRPEDPVASARGEHGVDLVELLAAEVEVLLHAGEVGVVEVGAVEVVGQEEERAERHDDQVDLADEAALERRGRRLAEEEHAHLVELAHGLDVDPLMKRVLGWRGLLLKGEGSGEGTVGEGRGEVIWATKEQGLANEAFAGNGDRQAQACVRRGGYREMWYEAAAAE
ncbi:hypothetical protein L1887_58676 [Cichorium endivia]|nr:hypothetical protein L1887_58676 [Cichorium endivia]